MKIDIADYRATCFVEIEDLLARIESNMNRLGRDRVEVELIDELFRDVHTIKGSSGVVGLTTIGWYAHEFESILERLRLGEMPMTEELADLLFFAADGLRALLVTERLNEPPMEDVTRTLNAMKQFLHRDTEATEMEPQKRPAPPVPPPPVEVEYGVAFFPAESLIGEGVEPLELFDALSRLGEIRGATLFTGGLPLFAEFDPSLTYFAWYHTLVSTRPVEEIRALFAGLAPEHHVGIAPLPTARTRSGGVGDDDANLAARLLEAGHLTEEALDRALHCLNLSRLPLEILALRTGRIDAEQFRKIREEMRTRGTPFTVCALHIAGLVSSAVESLVDLQASAGPRLAECLSGLNLIDPALLAEAAPQPDTDADANADVTLLEVEEVVAVPQPPAAPRPAAAREARVPASAAAMPPSDLMIENLGMLPEFLTEVQDHLNTADQLLLSLEKEPTRRDLLDALYRAFHTVKGAAGFFGLEDMKSLAHEAESLLNDARDGKITLTGRNADFAFGSLDGLNRQVQILRVWLNNRGDLARDDRSLILIADLQRLRNGTLVEPTPEVQAEPTPGFEVFEDSTATPAPTPAPVETEAKPKATGQQPASNTTGERETIRVDCERLDELINMIGELVISSSMVEQEVSGEMSSGSSALSQMNKIVRDLQELSLGLRMVPIAGTFRKMERIVRDLARKLGKKVQFVTEGEETELDKTVVDQIGDPLMHMVRNAVDHGIEMPDVRTAAGKTEVGTVRLRAFHQGGNIFIELTDDGKGLDRKAIYRKAVERGLIADGTVLSDSEICGFIFHPGFSTAKQVTDVSGRGVGMDVVRRNVEALQGSVTLRSEQGHGSTMTIRLPLTLAILDGLCVGLNQEVFVLPLLSVVESFQPGSSEVKKIAGQTEVILVRGEVVPLLRLYRIFQTPARCIDPTTGLVVIVEDQGKKVALLVDELLGQSQVVIKNLEKNFAKIDGIAGATILGNGLVGLILDIYGLTRMAGRSVTGLTEQDLTTPTLALQGVLA